MPTKIEKLPNLLDFCNDPDHYPPTHVSIPAGHRMVHTCPECGHVTIINSSSYILDGDFHQDYRVQ